MEILTTRLRLRRAEAGDLEAFRRILTDPRAMRYWSTPPHPDVETTRRWLDAMVSAPASESCDYVLEYRGEVVGKAGCWRLPEVGYILHPDVWGLGLADEAMRAILPHLFATFPVDALSADVDPRNAASIALLIRLGFVETRRARRTWLVGEEWCDSVYFALTRPPPAPDHGPDPAPTA